MDYSRNPLLPFFVLSIALHSFLLLTWPNSPARPKPPEPISVAFLPAPAEPKVKPPEAPTSPQSRPSRTPVEVAKKEKPAREEPKISPRETAPQGAPQKPREKVTTARLPSTPSPKVEPKTAESPARDLPRDQYSIAERALPSLKELLPPVTWSSSDARSTREDGPVHLNTREPQYVTYFTSVKRAIELVWQYPEPALRYGLQGKLVLEFTILENGDLDGARLVRSSGVSVLDEEAIRAVKAASPFHPIPPWIGKRRLDILATFEYLDNRLNYRFVP